MLCLYKRKEMEKAFSLLYIDWCSLNGQFDFWNFWICCLSIILLLNSPAMLVIFFRCREKQRKEASRLQAVNRKLTAMNKLLMEENDRLQKQVSQLVYENGYFRQHTQNVRIYTSFFPAPHPNIFGYWKFAREKQIEILELLIRFKIMHFLLL
jgi:hypothetical protein